VCQEMVEWLLLETENLEIRKMGKINIQSRDLVTALHMCFVKQIGKSASGTNQGAIDNRIEQAMDLVKSHLMNAVRSEVEELKEKIIKLEETISQQQIELTNSTSNFNREVGKLQAENQFLRNHVGSDVINQLSNLESFYADPVNQATQQQQQQNQVQNIQDSQSIQVSTTKSTAPSTQSQQSHQ